MEELYKKASIPTVESRGRGNIKRKVKRLWELRKPERQKKTNPSFKGVSRKRSKNGQVKVCWSDIKDKLFEVADKDKNVPNIEKAFLQDQRTSRKMEIGEVDKVETDKIVKRMSKKEREILAKEKED